MHFSYEYMNIYYDTHNTTHIYKLAFLFTCTVRKSKYEHLNALRPVADCIQRKSTIQSDFCACECFFFKKGDKDISAQSNTHIHIIINYS